MVLKDNDIERGQACQDTSERGHVTLPATQQMGLTIFGHCKAREGLMERFRERLERREDSHKK
jgi:hypothetical protein